MGAGARESKRIRMRHKEEKLNLLSLRHGVCGLRVVLFDLIHLSIHRCLFSALVAAMTIDRGRNFTVDVMSLFCTPVTTTRLPRIIAR